MTGGLAEQRASGPPQQHRRAPQHPAAAGARHRGQPRQPAAPQSRPGPCRLGRGPLSLRAVAEEVGKEEASSSSWEPTTAIWTEESRQDFERLQARFHAADQDRDGLLNREELRLLLETPDPEASADDVSLGHFLTEKDIDTVLDNWDTNKDGSIDYEEFAKLAHDNILLTGKVSEFRAAFAAVDTEGKGMVGANQLSELFEALGRPLPYEKLVEIMAKYDVDFSGKISFGEFMRMFQDNLFELQTFFLSAAQEILEYLKMGPGGTSSTLPNVQEAAAGVRGIAGQDTEMLDSSRALDEVLASDERLVVLLASLTWCRPCQTLVKPMLQLQAGYPQCRFLKFYGNTNDDTKELFKNRLKARVTPTFYFFRGGELVHCHTGANKAKLEYYIRQRLDKKALPPGLLFPIVQQSAGKFK